MAPRLQDQDASAIPRQSLVSAVADRLRYKIIRGELQEGEQLRQDAIAAEFQVSRIPVREALRRLEAEGLIKIIANCGAVVSALSPDEIAQLFEARAVLECHVLSIALPLITDEHLEHAEEVLNQYEHVVADEIDIAKWGAWNWEFHSALYESASRPVLMNVIRTLNNNCDRYTRMVLLFTNDVENLRKEHRMLLDACRARDLARAKELLWSHLMDAGERLKAFIKQRRNKF